MQAMVQEMLNSETGVPIRSHRHRLTVIPSVFTGMLVRSQACDIYIARESQGLFESPLHPTLLKFNACASNSELCKHECAPLFVLCVLRKPSTREGLVNYML